MLNVPLLRKVQLSIADPNNLFDMNNWGTCICGHAYSIVSGCVVAPRRWDHSDYSVQGMIDTLGVPREFVTDHPHASREQTIRAIDQLIEAEEATQRTALVPFSEPWLTVVHKAAPKPQEHAEERELACV